MRKKNPKKAAAQRLAHPEQWVTGDEPMTGAQEAYANTLAKQAGEHEIDKKLTKAEASQIIDELKREVGLPPATVPQQ
jgi:hypothetical protein